MSTSHMNPSHARNLVAQITQDDDGAHAQPLLELINGLADPEDLAGLEVKRMLYTMTEDFEQHFRAYLNRL